MKLRIRGNSLRLRLTQGEVAAIAADGLVAEHTAFAPGGAALGYRLRTDEAASRVKASFGNGEIEVVLPAATAERWAASDQVSIEVEQPIGDGGKLTILVEKDFACLTERPGEDDSDAFPHPGADKGESC